MNTSITVRTNDKLKMESQSILNSLGLDMSTAINMFLTQVVLKRAIPFSIDLEEPNEKTAKALAKAEKGEDLSKSFNNVDELLEALDAEN